MKICPLCGKENKKRADICISCGFNFGGTGHIPGGKRTGVPAKEKKVGRIIKIAALCLAAVLVFVGTGFLIKDLRTMKWHEDFDPIIGIYEGDILLYDLKRPSAKPLKIARVEDSEGVGGQYRKVYISKDRSSLNFSNGFEYYDQFFSVQCDVYTYDLEALPYFPKAVLRDVTDWTVNDNADIFTFEKLSDGKLGLYQNINGEEKLITDKYKVYSVSADGKDIAYSSKNKKLKVKTGETQGNLLSFSVSELTDDPESGEITFSLNGNETTADLPEEISVDSLELIITEKGSVLLCDKKSGKLYLYKNNRFVSFSQEGQTFLFPEYPKGETNVVRYDFSSLPIK